MQLPASLQELSPYTVARRFSLQARQNDWHFEFSRPLPPPQLPAPAEVERPASAVDAASLNFATDLSAGTLRYGVVALQNTR